MASQVTAPAKGVLDPYGAPKSFPILTSSKLSKKSFLAIKALIAVLQVYCSLARFHSLFQGIFRVGHVGIPSRNLLVEALIRRSKASLRLHGGGANFSNSARERFQASPSLRRCPQRMCHRRGSRQLVAYWAYDSSYLRRTLD